jgi:hypothetical protein
MEPQMSKPVTHLSKMVQRRDYFLTGTLCNRMSNASDDLNVTEHEAEVTCKFCLRLLVIRKRMLAA